MRSKIFLAVLAVIVIITLGAVIVVGKHKAARTGEVIHEPRSAHGFSRIEVNGLAEVTLRQGTREGVTVEGAASQSTGIETAVHDGTLVISTGQAGHLADWLRSGTDARTPHIVVDFVKLDRIESAGAIKVTAATIHTDQLDLDFAGACSLRIDDLHATHLRFEGSGAIKAEIAGAVDTQDVDLSGAGSYQASRLASNRAMIEVSGAGKAFVNAKTFLRATLSGAAVVEYVGDPQIEQEVSGLSKIVRRDAP
jgi:Putative auto-transporter adhesin, head GIN domain